MSRSGQRAERAGGASDVTEGGFPRRDERRRILALRDLAAVTLAGAVAGLAALIVLDAVFWLLGLGEFGRVNGWLAAILPVMLLVEEFRAWHGARGRVLVALASTLLALAVGLLVAGLAGDLPSLATGGCGALGFTAAYAPLWFYGIRMADGTAVDR